MLKLLRAILALSLFWSLIVLSATAQHPTIGGYNVYFGDLHNHSNVSDGTGTPAEAYNYAKNTAHVDFFGLSDHSSNSGSMTPAEWADIKNQADTYNQDGIFSSFYGFEWSRDTIYGHVTVLNTDDYCNTAPPVNTFEGLIVWLASRPGGLAFLNHPGREVNSFEFSHFTTTPSDQVVGIELWNRGDGFNTYYYNDGFYTDDNEKSYYDEANSRGWKLGAAGSGDNHFATWGTAYPYRMAILANNLTRTDLLEALRARRFYSTLDKNLSLSFKINGKEMGSTIEGNNYTVQIQAADADGEYFSQVVMYNQNHDIVNTWTLNTNAVDVSMNLSTTDGEYYYVKVRQTDGNEAISSPIWISGTTSNRNPVCSITSPSNGASFITPADITIRATAIDPDGSVASVEFYQGTTKLGEDLTSPFTFVWNGVTTGNYNITIKAIDNLDAVSTSSAVSISVGSIPITVTADSKTKVYGGSDPELTYHITSGSLVGSDTFTGSLTRDAGEDAGNHTIRQGTLTLDNKYALTFIPSNLAITPRPLTVRADAKTKIYGNTDPALTYSITSGSLVGDDSFSGSLSRETGENVGTYKILPGSLSLGANYNITFINADFIITQRSITVTADNITRVYGESDNLTYSITSGTLARADAFTGSLSHDSGDDVGTHAITRGSLTAGSNYNMTFIGAVLVITTRSITVTADNVSKVFGDPDHLTYTITSGSLAGEDILTGSLTRTAGEGIGTYSITIGTLSAGSNYSLTFIGANLSIVTRTITVTADHKIKMYGETENLTWRITSGNLLGNDTFSGNITRDPGENAGTYVIREGTLAINSNYTLLFIGSDLVITQRPINVTANQRTKVYGETDPDLTFRITSGSLVFTDSFSGALTRNPGENVGRYSINRGNLALNSNYALTFSGAELEITPRPISVAADPVTKVFGDPDPELTYQIISGSIAGNGDAFTGVLIREAGEGVGTYKITMGTLALSSNYNLDYIEADFSIGRSVIVVTADSKSKTYGEEDPPLTYQITSGTLEGEDKIEGELSRTQGEKAGSYEINMGTLGLNNNYQIDFIKGDLEITPRGITVTANPVKKVHGEPDPELTYQITSGTLVGEDSFNGFLERKVGEAVGIYPIGPGTLTLTDDYLLVFNEADFTITADYEIKTYPNPFTDHISFEVELSRNSDITLEVFNQSGIKIATVFSGIADAGIKRFDFISENLNMGLLIYQININGHVRRGKIIHVR
jgi:hypothetical protein